MWQFRNNSAEIAIVSNQSVPTLWLHFCIDSDMADFWSIIYLWIEESFVQIMACNNKVVNITNDKWTFKLLWR